MTAVIDPRIGTLIIVGVFIIVLGIRLWRMAREQRFRPVTMWILPAIFAAITALLVVADGFTTPLDAVLFLIALAIGGGIGWYQGTHTAIRYDHAIHAMFVKVSPLGSLIWIAVLALRFGVRYISGGFAAATTGPYGEPSIPAPSSGSLVSMLLLVLALGVIAGLRAYLQRAYALERATL